MRRKRPQKPPPAGGRGAKVTRAAAGQLSSAAILPHLAPNCQPPPRWLRDVDFLLWESERRRYLLRQAREYAREVHRG